MPYVYSTQTCSTAYVKYKPSSISSGHNQIEKRVVIFGGHGLSNKQLYTPKGVVTQVSDQDLEFLLQDTSFQKHMKDGFICIDKKKIEPEKKVVNMKLKDGSSPLTEKDFEKGENSSDDLRVYKGIHKAVMM